MNRRDALSSVAILLGGTIIGSEVFMLSGCNSSTQAVNDLFNLKDVKLLDEIAETIIPKTETPGAKDAKTGAFMAMMVKDCYVPEDQKIFVAGLKKIDDEAKKSYALKFMELDTNQRKQLLTKIDAEQKDYTQNKKKEEPTHYFRMMKELTMLGYFTSEEGGSKQLKYIEVPGRYDACIPYKKGDPVYLS